MNGRAGLPIPPRCLREKRQGERAGHKTGEGPVKKSHGVEQKEEGQHEVGVGYKEESPREFVMVTHMEQKKSGPFNLQETRGVWLGK